MGRKMFLALAVFVLSAVTGCYEYVPVAEPNHAAILPEEVEFFLEYLEENDLLVGDELLLEDENGEPFDDVAVTRRWDSADFSQECGCGAEDCEPCKFDRLNEIMEGRVIEAFGSDGGPVNIPRITWLMPPGSTPYFHVGVYYEPTQDCIDFILSHSGIAPERAQIYKSRIECQVMGCWCRDDCEYYIREWLENLPPVPPEGLPLICIYCWLVDCECDIYTDLFGTSSEEYGEEAQEIVPFAFFGIGALIQIRLPGRTGNVTMGHPMNAGFVAKINILQQPHNARCRFADNNAEQFFEKGLTCETYAI